MEGDEVMEPRTKAGQALWAKLVESIDSGDLHVDKADILAIEAEAAMPSLPADLASSVDDYLYGERQPEDHKPRLGPPKTRVVKRKAETHEEYKARRRAGGW